MQFVVRREINDWPESVLPTTGNTYTSTLNEAAVRGIVYTCVHETWPYADVAQAQAQARDIPAPAQDARNSISTDLCMSCISTCHV